MRNPVQPDGLPQLFSRRQRVALLAAFALLVVMRLPLAWVDGRFLDEEGAVFFAYAWHRPAAEALWRSFAGYLNLGANGVTLVAERLVRSGLVPLEAAPRITMAVALMVQVVPAALILGGRARWLVRRWQVVAALLVLAVAPMTEEVFANSLHIQFHLALASALILALGPPGTRVGAVVDGLVLLIAPLCGPGAIVLLPFFAVRALIDRDRARVAQACTLALGSAIQLLLFFHGSPVRGGRVDPVTLAAILFTRLVAMPLGGPALANGWGGAIHASRAVGGIGWLAAGAAGAVVFAALHAAALRERREAAWLVAPGLAIAAVTFGIGMIATDSREWFSVGAAERYQFLPLVLIGLGLVALAGWSDRLSLACRGPLGLMLGWGAVHYAQPLPELSQGPSWPAQVAAWRGDHAHPLLLWPRPWMADLSDRDRPCPAYRHADPTAPGYCESAWIAQVTPARR